MLNLTYRQPSIHSYDFDVSNNILWGDGTNFQFVVLQTSQQDVESGAQVTAQVTGAKGKSTDVSTKRRSRKTRPVRVLLRRLAVMAIFLAVLVGLAGIFGYFFGWQFLIQLVIVVIVAYLAAGYWRWLYVAAVTAPRDIR